jgi:hypothetical protein
VWREELEEVLEQEHGVRRVEPPPLLSPAHSRGTPRGSTSHHAYAS